ncbi:FxSxx-COOH system tetratricopeptide repeat protein [Streptomyces sp. MAR4 CNX-425]|uniref:FxSxx-COOH system tetratricopeptide repeat protein n=1 Tax=Streptomyces sp. MAR4 CNX-425 TaxID=3406343 RepID=UPI003B514842
MPDDDAQGERSGPAADPAGPGGTWADGPDLTPLWDSWPAGDGGAPHRVLLVVDAHVTVQVWGRQLAQLRRVLTDSFAEVRSLRLLRTDETAPARVHTDVPLDPARPAGARTVVLVATDGLAAGWHLGVVQELLREWGRKLPVAVIELLPPPLWYRTGLTVSRLRVRADHAWAANGTWEWRERDVPAASPGHPDDDAEGEPSVMPVLSLTHHGARALAHLLSGDAHRWVDLPAFLAHRWKNRPDLARPLPWLAEPPDGTRQQPAADRVFDFRAAASPTAFRLATRLAAAPLSLPVIRRVVESTPVAGPVHAAEFFMSGLVRPTGVHDDAPGALAYEFTPGTREQLLALGRRSATARTLRDVHAVLASDPGSATLLPPLAAPLDESAVPAVTRRSAAFLRVELAALSALSGSFPQRAAILRKALKWHDQWKAARSPEAPPTASPTAPPVSAAGEGAPSMSTTSQRTLDTERAGRPRIWGNLPPRNQNFTGRDELLALLEQRLQEGTTTVLPEAIHGMGGVGKTQLAIEYAYRHQDEYDIVWWIPSERPGQIGQSLVELAKRLGLETTSEVNVAAPVVREALREGKPYARWLLIFDNADSPEQVRPYFPTGGTGTIVVTSRNRRWSLVGGSLDVDVFTREESKKLLSRSGPELADEEAEALAAALGDLPLALVQAAAWRTETGMPTSEYLRLFEDKKNELLETAPPPDYQLPVAAAWNVSLDHLEQRSPTALRLLELCSYFAPDPISRSVLKGPGPQSIYPELDSALNDPMKLARAIREINRYSLARIDHRTNSIEMHRLVQLVLVNRMSPEEQNRMRQGAHSLMATADPKEPNDPSNWPRYAELYTHVIASDAVRSDQPWVRQLVLNVARYLYRWGDHDAAVEFSEEAWSAWTELFSAEDSLSLLMGQHLGFMYWAVGRYGDAARLVGQLRQTYDRTQPADSEDALEALQLEAAVRRAEGRFAEGAEIDKAAHERALQAFGEEDPTTLNVAHNYAVSLRLMGDFQGALELDRQTWLLRQRLFGRDDPRSLATEVSVAIDVRESGDYVGALPLQETAVAARQDILGSRNPFTFHALRELSITTRKAGDHARSLELAIEAHEGFTRRYGEDHPRSLAAALSLSIALRQTGDLDAARVRGAKACEGYRHVYSAEHPYALAADVDLALSERLLGRPEEARRLDEHAIRTLTDVLGDDHPHTLVAAVNLASDMAALGDHEEALRWGRPTLSRCQEVFGTDHPTTLACAGNLSLDLAASGDVEEATALRQDTLERLRRALAAPEPLEGEVPTTHPAILAFTAGLRADCDIDPAPL